MSIEALAGEAEKSGNGGREVEKERENVKEKSESSVGEQAYETSSCANSLPNVDVASGKHHLRWCLPICRGP